MDPSAPGELAKNTPKRKEEALSNAMRTGKRTLAGVAAGALALALVPFVATTSAQAATGSATVSPVRVTFTGSTQDAVPFAAATWDNAAVDVITGDDTTLITLSSAPSAAATITIDGGTGGTDDTINLNAPSDVIDDTALSGTGDDSIIRLKANAAGTYAGTLTGNSNTISWSFTTTTAPATMELAPATQTVLEGATATLSVTLKDAAGNMTQPSSVDTVALSVNTDDTLSASSVTDDSLALGVYEFELDTTGNGAGTTTVTATPQGTLGATGVTAQTATVTKSGTVNSVAAESIIVTAPANASPSPANTDDTLNRAVDVPQGTSTVTVQVDDTTGNDVGSTIRLKVFTSAGTVNGGAYTSSNALFLDLQTDANRQITETLTLGGAAVLPTSTLTVQQVDVNDTQIVSGDGLVVTQKAPGVSAGTVTVSPDDSNVAQLGATTAVTVSVDDSFGNPQVGWTVAISRGSSFSLSSTLDSGPTNSSGEAVLDVTNATGATAPVTESYSIQIDPPVGTAFTKNDVLQITYTADGTVTSISVEADPALSPTPVTNTTTAVVTAPVITVVSSGTADSKTSETFVVATGANSTTNPVDGNYAEFTATADPLNSVTVTTPEGVSVAADEDTAWDAGSTSLTVSSGTPVRVFATKVGVHTITFTSGGKTATVPVKVVNTANDAYNIAIAPTEQNVAAGAIGTATVTITDVFGNPVQTQPASGSAADDTGVVTVQASGEILLAGFDTNRNFGTNASGEATVTFIAGNAAGTGSLAVTPLVGTPTPAWQTDYTPPTNAPAPVTSAAATVTVGTGPVTASIIIAGERGEVRDRPGILVDGVTQGIAEGTIVRPWIKFPGETTYSQGVAQRSVAIFDASEELGEFAWQRRTGKKIYVYFRTEDDAVQSTRIIIPAR